MAGELVIHAQLVPRHDDLDRLGCYGRSSAGVQSLTASGSIVGLVAVQAKKESWRRCRKAMHAKHADDSTLLMP